MVLTWRPSELSVWCTAGHTLSPTASWSDPPLLTLLREKRSTGVDAQDEAAILLGEGGARSARWSDTECNFISPRRSRAGRMRFTTAIRGNHVAEGDLKRKL
jgi:hypothetical protein